MAREVSMIYRKPEKVAYGELWSTLHPTTPCPSNPREGLPEPKGETYERAIDQPVNKHWAALASDPSRFWSKVKIGTASECWAWLSTKAQEGYGHFRVGGFYAAAH